MIETAQHDAALEAPLEDCLRARLPAQPDLPILRAGCRGRFAERLDLGDAVEPGERIDAAFSADQHAPRNRRLGAGDGAVKDLATLRDQEQVVAEPFGVLHDVRREQHGRPPLGEIADQLFEDLLVDGVEAREGLVEDDELGLVRDGADHLDLLAHALRERLDLGIRELAETVALEQFVGALLRGLARESLQRGEVGDRRGSGHRLVESLLLRQVADARPDVERRRRAEYRDAPARRLDDVEDHADRRRLSGAVRPEEAVDGPARDRQAHVVDRGEVAEALRDIFELEHLVVHRLPSPPVLIDQRAGLPLWAVAPRAPQGRPCLTSEPDKQVQHFSQPCQH